MATSHAYISCEYNARSLVRALSRACAFANAILVILRPSPTCDNNRFFPVFLKQRVPSLNSLKNIIVNKWQRMLILFSQLGWRLFVSLWSYTYVGYTRLNISPSPAETGYGLSLQTVLIQISWLLKKPTDLDLHCLPLSMWIYSNNLDQVIWLAEN